MVIRKVETVNGIKLIHEYLQHNVIELFFFSFDSYHYVSLIVQYKTFNKMAADTKN